MQDNNRRDFLKKAFGLSAVIGMAAVVTSLESCSKLSGDVYTVNTSKCNGCQKCYSACGSGAISFSNSKASISSSKCIGCAHCVRVCAQSAISLA